MKSGINHKKVSVQKGASLRTVQKAITRDRIIDAAKISFINDGYRGASLQKISQLAGTTTTTFYRYFSSKSDLIWIIRDELTKVVHGAVKELVELEKPDIKDIKIWLNSYDVLWENIHALDDAYWEATLLDEDLRKSTLAGTLSFFENESKDFLKHLKPSQRKSVCLRLSLMILTLDRIAFLAHAEDTKKGRDKIYDEFAYILHCCINPT